MRASRPAAAGNAFVGELAGLSRELSQLGAIGLESLDYLENGEDRARELDRTEEAGAGRNGTAERRSDARGRAAGAAAWSRPLPNAIREPSGR